MPFLLWAEVTLRSFSLGEAIVIGLLIYATAKLARRR